MSDYVAGRLQEALAHAGETDVHVAIDGDDGPVVLTGNVATDERHAEVLELARQTAQGHEVVDRIAVLHVPEPSADRQEAIS